jgi:exonuclease III
LGKAVNLHATSALLEVEGPDLLFLSELWNQKERITLHQEYDSIISKPSKYEGVAVFFKKRLEVRPYKEDQWTSNYIFGKMNNTIIVSVYINPREPKSQFETVMWHIN